MAYATRDDVFNLGLSAVAFVSRPRAIVLPGDLDLATGRIELRGHGFSTLDAVRLHQVATGALPTDASAVLLSKFVYYTPSVVGNDIFQLINPATGLPFTFATSGSGWAISVDPMRRLDMHLEDTAGQIDDCLTGQSPPILPDPVTGRIPWQLRGMNARMAALACSTSLQFDNAEARVAIDRIEKQRAADDATRADWKAGKPLLPEVLDQTSLVADDAMRARSRCPIPWARRSL